MMDFHIIIPARYESQRLPGKVLMDIAGKPMVQHVYEKALDAGAESVVIATESDRVAEVAESFGAKVCMTSSIHRTGTERLSEAVEALEFENDEVVIGLQADEPFIDVPVIRMLVEDLETYSNIKVASVCEPITDAQELFDRGVVKVVLNRRGHAVYFSRAVIPWDRDSFTEDGQLPTVVKGNYYRHVGLYGYRVGFLKDYMEWGVCSLESVEMLEQLRILWNGGRIYMRVLNKKIPLGVNTELDLERVRGIIKK